MANKVNNSSNNNSISAASIGLLLGSPVRHIYMHKIALGDLVPIKSQNVVQSSLCLPLPYPKVGHEKSHHFTDKTTENLGHRAEFELGSQNLLQSAPCQSKQQHFS